MAPSRPRPGDTTQRPLLSDDEDEASVAKTRERAQFKSHILETAPNPIIPPLQTDKQHIAETAPNPIVQPRQGLTIPDTAPSGSTPGKRDSLIDTTVSGYRVEGVLGRGAAGIVYKVHHLTSSKKAAFKVLKPEFAQDPEYIRRLVEEARALTAIRHPGIIDILDFGALPNGQPYLVMELCDGLSLEEQLKFGGQPTVHETLALLEELFDALSAAHGRGIVHRDLKPSNLFLASYADGSRVLKVLDFGLARRSDSRKSIRPTMPGTMVGTPDYMPPEQVKGEKMGPYSDIYAVGGIAFRLLANRLPFIAANSIAVITKKMEQPQPHLRDIDPKIPRELDDLVFRMLAPIPKDRPTLKEARAGFAAYRSSLRRGPIPSLLDEDPSTGPTAFHDFKQEHQTVKEVLPPVRPGGNRETEISLRPPNASPPPRPTDLEMRAQNEGGGLDTAKSFKGESGPNWLLLIAIGLMLASGAGFLTWFLLRH